MPQGTCSIDDCPDRARCRGWCNGHYARWRKYGDPLGRPQPPIRREPGTTEAHEQRFWSRVLLPGATGCMLWTDPLEQGYGHFWDGSRGTPAHTFSWKLAYGEPPGDDRTQLDHLCHTYDPSCPPGVSCPHRRCVNPDHLEWVTPAENSRRALVHEECDRGHRWDEQIPIMRDGRRSCRLCQQAREAGYRQRRRDEAPPRERVRARGERIATTHLTEADVRAIRGSSLPNPVIAPLYGLSPSSVSRIRTRATWAHVA